MFTMWATSDQARSSSSQSAMWTDSPRPGGGARDTAKTRHRRLDQRIPKGLARPKSRFSGCEPAALTSVSFPGCPPGPLILAAAAARNRLWLLKVLRSQVTPLTPRDVDPGGSCIAENRAFKVCSDVHITPASIWAVADLVRWSR